MKTALVTIATGEKYHQYVRPLFLSAQEFFVPHDFFLWSDTDQIFFNAYQFKLRDEGFPGATLHRYHTFLQQKEQLSSYDYIFYVDIDMKFISPIKEEDIFSDGITATLHPGYVGKVGTPERNPASRAYIPLHATNQYLAGGFNGGLTRSFLWMAEHIKECVDIDAANGVTAIWNDESYLNAFLYYNNPPAKVLSPAFCFPESEYKQPGGYYRQIWDRAGLGPIEPRLLALDKVK